MIEFIIIVPHYILKPCSRFVLGYKSSTQLDALLLAALLRGS